MNSTSNGTPVPVTDNSSFLQPNRVLFVILYRYGLGLVFLIGFLGNLASLVTFMSRTLRIISTGSLFFMITISDTLYLMISIFEFVEVGIVQGAIFLSVYDSVCRFRWFSKGLIRFCSAWLLVLVAMDRWMRTRFPFKANEWCTRRNAMIAVLITIVFGFALHGQMLSIELFGRFFPGIPSVACGPIDPSSPYAPFFFTQWPIIQVTFISIIPGFLMVISSINIYHTISKEKKRIQPTSNNNPTSKRQTRLQRHMLLLMISSATIFLATTLPISLSQIINAYRIAANTHVDINEIINEEAIVNLILDFNYTVFCEKISSWEVYEVLVSTEEVLGDQKIRIIVPTDYTTSGLNRRYPVLYLLHGAGGSEIDWTTSGIAGQVCSNLSLITVMPNGGDIGFYTNWIIPGRLAPQNWRTFHMEQLVPWIDFNLRTVVKKQGRAIAGNSMGGFGSIHYAELYSSNFVYAASFSGALDLVNPVIQGLIYNITIIDNKPLVGPFGYPSDPISSNGWFTQSTTTYAAALHDVSVALYTGNVGSLEMALRDSSYRVRDLLTLFGSSVYLMDYENGQSIGYGCDGNHNWLCFNAALIDVLPRIMTVLQQQL